MIFSGQRLGQDAAGRTGYPVSPTAAATVNPVAGSASVNQAILPAKVTVNVPVPLGVVSVTGTIHPPGGVMVPPVAVAGSPVVGGWLGNKAVKPAGSQVAVNKWQEGLVARSSDVSKSVGNQTGKGQNGVGTNGVGVNGTGQTGTGTNGKGPGSRSSSSWW
jgi:hypothetical protein